VDLNFLETLKNNNGNVVSSYAIIANTNTDDVFKKLIFINCPSCNHSFLAAPYNTILHDNDEQELENLFSKLEKKLEDLMEAKKKPEFSNIYILDTFNIPNEVELDFGTIDFEFHIRIHEVNIRIIDCISNIFKQLRYQRISQHGYIVIVKVLNFTMQVFTFINDCKFIEFEKLIEQSYFDDRFKYQKYKFSTLFSDLSFLEMIILVEKIIYKDLNFDLKKGDELMRYLGCLKKQFKYMHADLKFYTENAEIVDNLYMKFLQY
ncbi:hypothetical protein AAJ76_9200013823, partial [Vairimorpha ceranae]